MEHWASKELQGANLGHERFRPNAIKMLARLGENPGLSFSAACGPAIRKSANRLFSHSDIDLQKGHVEQTVNRSIYRSLVLAVEDTTDVNYSRHKAKKGMGILGGPLATSVPQPKKPKATRARERLRREMPPWLQVFPRWLQVFHNHKNQKQRALVSVCDAKCAVDKSLTCE